VWLGTLSHIQVATHLQVLKVQHLFHFQQIQRSKVLKSGTQHSGTKLPPRDNFDSLPHTFPCWIQGTYKDPILIKSGLTRQIQHSTQPKGKPALQGYNSEAKWIYHGLAAHGNTSRAQSSLFRL